MRYNTLGESLICEECTVGAAEGDAFGTFIEAHVDSQFGNQANWLGMRDTTIGQFNGENGGVSELVIAWTDFDADAKLASGTRGPDVTTGLHHPMAPESGDKWFFQASNVTTDPNNFQPVWNWTSSLFSAAHPHGEITFVRAGKDADFNDDGSVNGDDFLLWQAGFGTQNGASNGDGDADGDGDGDVDGDDFLLWQANFEVGSGSGAVPEPATAVLLVLSACGLFLRRRRR